MEVHRHVGWLDADVGQVAEDVAGRDVERATHRDAQLGEVAADAIALKVDVEGGRQRIGAGGPELDLIVDPVADRLNPRPTGRGLPEQVPGRVGKYIRQDVATRQGEHQGLVRQR